MFDLPAPAHSRRRGLKRARGLFGARGVYLDRDGFAGRARHGFAEFCQPFNVKGNRLRDKRARFGFGLFDSLSRFFILWHTK